MPKLAVLLDPNKKIEVERVYNALQDLFEEDGESFRQHMEIWVGDTHEVYKGVHAYLRRLKEAEIFDVPIVIFPGHPFQVSAYADFIMIPDLLNVNNRIMPLVTKLGKIYHFWFKVLMSLRGRSFPLDRKYGYLVLSPHSSVGRKLDAKELSDEEALEIIERGYRRHYRDWWGLYIEAGSGVTENLSTASRLELVSESKKIIGSKVLLTGGGIRTSEQVQQLCEAGSDIVVVSTVLEKTENPKKLIKEFLTAVIDSS